MGKPYNWNVNSCQIGGRLASDPYFKVFDDTGSKVIYFTVAVNRSTPSRNGERNDETLFMEVQAWNGMADSLNKFLRKGTEILVDGHLETYKNRNGVLTTRLVAESYLPGVNCVWGDDNEVNEPTGNTL